MRPDAVWSDGVPVTAHDFEYTIQRYLDPKTAAIFASFLYPIDNARAVNKGELPVEAAGVRALDDMTLEFRLERPVPYFIDLMAQSTFAPVPRHAIDKFGIEWTRPGTMVSNGPYVLAERLPQSHIKLVKNPLFHDAAHVAVDEVYFYPTQDLGAALNRFRAGELDLVLSFPPDKIDWINRNMPDALSVVPALGVYYIALKVTAPPFDDVRVRHALSLAIDRELVTDQLLRTGVKPAYGFVSSDVSNYPAFEPEEQAASFAERQQKARDLLAQAGFGPANPLTFSYKYDSQEESRKVAVALAGMWSAVGVKTDLVDKEFRAIIGDRLSGDFEALRLAFFSPLDDPYFFLELFETGNPGNSSHYSNPAVDDLLERSAFARETGARMALLSEAERTAMEDQAVIPVFFYVWRRLVQPYVKGWKEGTVASTPSRYLRIER
jgi:oligopeptide transport system substrate-binding protein